MKGSKTMYNNYNSYPYPNSSNAQMYDPYNMYNNFGQYPYPYWNNTPEHCPDYWRRCPQLKDYGPNPFTINIEEATLQNNNFRIALWTGEYLQLTLMSINVGDDIGLEMHPDVDQFLRVEQGEAIVMMGDNQCNLDFRRRVSDNYAIIIPAGKWHNIINTGCVPLKMYSIYAPPNHPYGTVHRTKEDAEEHH